MATGLVCEKLVMRKTASPSTPLEVCCNHSDPSGSRLCEIGGALALITNPVEISTHLGQATDCEYLMSQSTTNGLRKAQMVKLEAKEEMLPFHYDGMHFT